MYEWSGEEEENEEENWIERMNNKIWFQYIFHLCKLQEPSRKPTHP